MKKREPKLLNAAAWMPALGETKPRAHSLRVRTLADVVGYRYAAAVGKNLAEPDRVARVLGRELPDGPVRAFNCHMSAAREAVVEEIAPACTLCGCTEDAACVSYPPHLDGCPSNAGNITAAEALMRCTCGSNAGGQACAWASRAPFICTACT